MESLTIFQYEEIKHQILNSAKSASTGRSMDGLVGLCRPMIANAVTELESDIKAVVDTAFRDILYQFIVLKDENDYDMYDSLLNLSIEAVRQDICSGNLPVMLLTDLFDMKTLVQCEKLFELVERRVDIWKEEKFFNNVKNQMLRSCNDLLRRLSNSQNTVFGGRILEFLAQFFPLFERSGLNLTSEFNQDNTVVISTEDDELPSLDDDLQSQKQRFFYNLYGKFWKLQEYFRQPNLCYNKPNWKQFQNFTSDVLAAFSPYKYEDEYCKNSESIKGNHQHQMETDDQYEATDHTHFTKYLTNQKLLELQLSDSNFRRYILVQFLILHQYLITYPLKSKHESHSLTEDQTIWLTEAREKVLRLLEETPGNGEEMRKSVQNVLKREEFWSQWKNDGCPSLREVADEDRKLSAPLKRKLSDEIRNADTSSRIVIGNAELNRLWNLCPDNWEACMSKKRIFTPTIENCFGGKVDELRGQTGEERQKNLSESSDFTWRALRLLSQKSPHFFTPSNQIVRQIPVYLDSVLEKIGKDIGKYGSKNNDSFSVNNIDDTEDISNDELLKQVDDNSNMSSGKEASVNSTTD